MSSHKTGYSLIPNSTSRRIDMDRYFILKSLVALLIILIGDLEKNSDESLICGQSFVLDWMPDLKFNIKWTLFLHSWPTELSMKVSRSFRQIIISQLGFTTVTNRTQQLPNKFQTHLGANSSSNNVIKSTPSSELTLK